MLKMCGFLLLLEIQSITIRNCILVIVDRENACVMHKAYANFIVHTMMVISILRYFLRSMLLIFILKKFEFHSNGNCETQCIFIAHRISCGKNATQFIDSFEIKA